MFRVALQNEYQVSMCFFWKFLIWAKCPCWNCLRQIEVEKSVHFKNIQNKKSQTMKKNNDMVDRSFKYDGSNFVK